MEKERNTKKIQDWKYSNDDTLTEYIVKNGIEEIGTGAFAQCFNLKQIKLARETRKIGMQAFFRCANLKEITWEVGLEEINDRAFFDCGSMERLELVKGIRKIGNRAFGYIYYLTHVEMNEGLEEIGMGIFEWCQNLRTISFPLHKIRYFDTAALVASTKWNTILDRRVRDGPPLSLETLILRTTYQRHPSIPFPRIYQKDNGQLVRFIEAQQETYLEREVRISRNIYYSLFVLKYTNPFVYNFDRMNTKKAGEISKRIFGYWFRGFWYKSAYPLSGVRAFHDMTKGVVLDEDVCYISDEDPISDRAASGTAPTLKRRADGSESRPPCDDPRDLLGGGGGVKRRK